MRLQLLHFLITAMATVLDAAILFIILRPFGASAADAATSILGWLLPAVCAWAASCALDMGHTVW